MVKSKLLTIEDVAQKIDRSTTTVYRLRNKANFPEPVPSVYPKQWREADVDKWIEKNEPQKRKKYERSPNNETIEQVTAYYQEEQNFDSIWSNIEPDPWYVRYNLWLKALGTAIFAGAAAAIVSNFLG